MGNKPDKCGQACPCCGKYRLWGTSKRWVCKGCGHTGTLQELAVQAEKLLKLTGPDESRLLTGSVVLEEEYEDLTDDQNEVIRLARSQGYQGGGRPIEILDGAYAHLGEE